MSQRLKPTRREFLKTAALSGAGLLLSSCDGSPREADVRRPASPATPTTPRAPSTANFTASANDVVFIEPGHAQYDSLRQGFNKRVDRSPAVIALCRTTLGVATAIQYARQKNLSVAIKSGGHSFEGASCNDGGLVVNLSQLNDIEWLGDDGVRIGPGCTLSMMYDSLLPKRRLIPAGSCGGVGVGGLTLGGGYGFFSRKYGLTCDSLTEATLVDGAGNVHSSKDDPDLLWACRGGGNGNFGVVTEMTFTTHPAPRTFQSFRFHAFKLDAERAASILHTWFEQTAGLPDSCFSAFVLNGRSLLILVTCFEKPSQELQVALDRLKSATDRSSYEKPRPLASALKTFYGRQSPMYFKNASAGLYDNFGDIELFIAEALDLVVRTPGMIYQVNTLGGAIARSEFAEASAFPHRARRYLSELQTYWTSQKQGGRLIAAFQDVQTIFHQHGIVAQYANYPSLEFEQWETAYYGDNYARLQSIKRKYDPDNIIRHDQSVRG